MKWLIVAGCGHSGTTLTAKIISTNKNVHWIKRETGMFFPLNAAKLRKRIEKEEEAIRGTEQIFICEKTPRHIHFIDNIRRELSLARFILCTRDPYDTITSIAARFDGDNISKRGIKSAFQRFIIDNLALIQQIKESDCHVHRYEDFIANPEESIRLLCSHLGLDFDPRMLKTDSHQTSYQGTYGDANATRREGEDHIQRRAWQVNQQIFDGRNRWKTMLTEENKEYLEHLLNSEISLWVLKHINYTNEA